MFRTMLRCCPVFLGFFPVAVIGTIANSNFGRKGFVLLLQVTVREVRAGIQREQQLQQGRNSTVVLTPAAWLPIKVCDGTWESAL